VTISDAMEMRAIQQGPGLVIDAVAATIAGIDLLLLNADHADQRAIYAGLVQATQRNVLNRADILRSAQRVLALKQWVGQVPQPDLSVVHCAEHRALAREIAERSVTLVRDDARRLPLRLAIDARIAVVVPRPVDLTPADTSSYERCQLADAVRHYHAATDEFLVSADPDVNQIAVLIEQLTSYDVIIVGTINVGAQRGQAALVNALLAHELPLITVALRLPYDLAAYPTAPTYLCTYSLHEAAMTALAAALWGEIPTTGRLPVSIPGLYPRGHGGHP
jgi:beta-N-acetylhexosaminidase